MLLPIVQYLLLALAWQGVLVTAWVAIALTHILLDGGRNQEHAAIGDQHYRPFNSNGLIAWIVATVIGIVMLQRSTAPGEPGYEELAKPGAPQGLVVCPTRELASQVRDALAPITEALGGRAFEITPQGEIIWEFINRYDERRVAIVEPEAPRRPVVLDRRSPVLHLVPKIRDASHRFAVTYHRKRRQMRDRDSELLEIPGVGPRTRQRLIEHFGSIRGIRQAGPDALTAVVNSATAARIRKHFDEVAPDSSHDNTLSALR